MSQKIAAGRYAHALTKIDNGNVSLGRENLKRFEGILELFKLKESSAVLNSPVMPTDLKVTLLNYGLEKSGATNELKGFIETVAHAKRVDIIPEIIERYSELLDELEGIISADITSAIKLPETELTNIISELEKVTGKKINVSVNVNPAILGGYIINMGNTLLDLSLKTKLDAITKSATL